MHSRNTAPLALIFSAGAALAQAEAPQNITITGSARSNAASVAGFGDVPLAKAPFSATVISTRQLADAGISSLGDLTRLDAGITDAYNPTGYWSQMAVRGFTLDLRFNYQRDGLPINAETALLQANKSAIEVLKGSSGMQAGTSAPGGLVNLVVKRPQGDLRSAALSVEQPGSLGAALDLGGRFGADAQAGWRLNASAERLGPAVRNARGQRHLLAGAAETRLGADGLLEAEFELSHQSQPSVPGFSLLGSRLPDARQTNPRLNLNNQQWSLPVVFEGHTASLRYTQRLRPELELVAHGMSQRLRTDDRVAFPYGCGTENDYSRYCSDGSFDFYDFRSEGERRRSDALDVSLTGRARWAGAQHYFKLGLLGTRFTSRFGLQAYNYVGSGTVDGASVVPPDPRPLDQNTQRDERSTELHLQDRVELTPTLQLWAGLRHTQLRRDSVRTNGSRATAYSQAFSTPWLALSRSLGGNGLAYANWAQGIESEVAPNRATYTNAGQALPALKSSQWEAGYKHSGTELDWQLVWFDMRRPAWRDLGSCDATATCTRREDGNSRHMGVELESQWRSGPMSLRASATALRARREASADVGLNGKRPTNVPAFSLKLQGAYNLQAVPGLAVLGFITHEGRRMVLADNSLDTPGWTRLDLAARYTQTLGSGSQVVWRAGIDNLANRRAWKEAPTMFEHVYLYPLAPREFHASWSLRY